MAVGALLQLQASGSENVYLTQKPDINIFKYIYYRYINFSTEIIQTNLNEFATFGRTSTCNILKKGHLLSKIYLHLKLPALEKINGTYLSWTDTLGYAIFDGPIELSIDGNIVDRMYPVFSDMWDELTTNKSKRDGRNLMLLKSDIYRTTTHNAEQETSLMIPLDFWFTKDYSLALPLVALNSNDIKIKFTLKNFNDCINYDGSLAPTSSTILESSIYAEYIWIDDQFINYFKSNEHFYIINQLEYHDKEIINENILNYTTHLKFKNPSKELLIACVDSNNIINNNHLNYSRSDDKPFIQHISMYLDGRMRFDNLPEFYYRCIFPDTVHTNIPTKYIYTVPFSLKPEDNQPTGSLAMNRFTDISLNFNLTSDNPEMHMYIFSIMYNFLTIKNGKLFFEYPI